MSWMLSKQNGATSNWWNRWGATANESGTPTSVALLKNLSLFINNYSESFFKISMAQSSLAYLRLKEFLWELIAIIKIRC